jgi:L-lactate utilization protein LutB
MDFTEIRKKFEKHGFFTSAFSTKEEAVKYLTDSVQGEAVGFGGSVTLNEMGLFEALSEKNIVVWHHRIASEAVRRLASSTSVYFTSANGVSKDGMIVNIDGRGNRLAMTEFGPKKVFYVVGRNKIAESIEGAIWRARNVASPKNAVRVNAKTPCAVKGGGCHDCNSPERICRMLLITARAPLGMESEIIFVDEDLGY